MSHINKDMSKNLPFMYEDVFNGVLDSITRNSFTLKSKNPNTGHVVASTGISLLSWGEDINIYIKSIDGGNTSVSVSSELKVALNFAAGHRHEENFQKIINGLGFYLYKNNCKSDSYQSESSSSDLSKRDLINTFFYKNKQEYRKFLQAEGLGVKKIDMFMSLYDGFMFLAVGVSKSKSGSQELSWLLNDDKILFQSYIYVCHISFRLLSEYIKEPKLSQLMSPFVSIAFSYASSCKNIQGHKKTLGGVLNPVDDLSNTDIMKNFKSTFRAYALCDSLAEVRKSFMESISYAWRTDEKSFEEVINILDYMENKGKDPSAYFEDYMDRTPEVIEQILIKGLE